MNNLYFNEFDPYPAQWLRNLFPEAEVDDRSIKDVNGENLPDRCHFFAGIGGWELALQLAGWLTDREVWTGSCPCQPFSQAGKRKGIEDERHLWPEFLRLISQCKPATIFGEQVASLAGREWLAGVQADMEALGYKFAAADLCAAGVGAPHIRQRLYWVADRNSTWKRKCQGENGGGVISNNCWLDWTNQQGLEIWKSLQLPNKRASWETSLAVLCADGKERRIEPGVLPLANGIPKRMGRIRAYGNAIVPQVASMFIRAFMEAEMEQ